MKMSIKSAMWPAIILIVLLLCLWLLLDAPWLFGAYTDVDINSGDTRDQVRVFSLAVKTEVKESALSRELHRLGIDIPPTRAWQHISGGHLMNGTGPQYRWGSVIALCSCLLSALDQAKAPDEERRAILETVMASFRKGDPEKARIEILIRMAEVGERHSLEILLPEVKDYVIKLRDER